MARVTVTETDFKSVPEDTFIPAKLAEISMSTIEYADKKSGEFKSFDKFVWWFEVTDGEYAGRKLKGETGAEITSHPNNTFRQWVEALLNEEVPVGFEFDTDDLVGLPCELTVRHVAGTGKNEGKTYENVDTLIPRLNSPDTVPF